MRYYEITITQSEANLAAGANAFPPITFSTLDSAGKNNTSALKIDLDVFQTWFHQPAQLGYLRVYGVSYETLKQGANLSNTNISIKVGMSKGLPFANPAQQGLVINGTIFQAFGNWQGNMVTLDLVIVNQVADITKKPNLSFVWEKGVPLQTAITQTLQNAYGTVNSSGARTPASVYGQLSPKLIYTETQPYTYTSLESFSLAMNRLSKQIIANDQYMGASITSVNGGFLLDDGTAPATETINVDYQDLVGNLTWLDLYTVQAKLVMRGKIDIGNYVKFPALSPATSTANSFSQLRRNVSFNGVFRINKIRHVGSSRQADANSWVTIIDCTIPDAITAGSTGG